MQLVIWIGFCVVVAILTRNRPRIYLSAVVAGWFAIPVVGSRLVTGEAGGPLSFHSATWLIVALAGVQLLHNPRAVAEAVAKQFHVFLVLALVLGAALVATFAGRGSVVVLVDQLLAPVVFFLLVVAAGMRDPGLLAVLRNLLLVLGAAVSVVALVQASLQQVIFYESGFLTQYWFNPDNGRWMGTIDQPLALSLALCMIGPLVVGLRNPVLQVGLLVLFGAGILVSQSRVGIVVFGLVSIYVVLRSRGRWQVKLPVMVLLGGAAGYLASSTLSEGLAQRFADDTGSTAARTDALALFLDRWQDYLVAGDGMSASYRVSAESGLATSLESSFLMYAVDIGVVFALLYFGLMAVLIVANWRQRGCPGLGLSAMLGLLIVQTYSALATRSVAGILIWTVLALLVLAGRQARSPQGDAAGHPRAAVDPPRRSAEAELAAAMRAAAGR